MHFMTLGDMATDGPAALPASGGGRPGHRVTGGRVHLSYRPDYLGRLLKAGTFVLPVAPATTTYRDGVTDVFPVTGGSVGPAARTGRVSWTGGTQYVNLRAGKWITLTGSSVDLQAGTVDIRTDQSGPIAPFDTPGADPLTPPDARVVTADLVLSGVAASTLNRALHTLVFTDGLAVGELRLTLLLAGLVHGPGSAGGGPTPARRPPRR